MADFDGGTPSLPESYRSIPIAGRSAIRKFFAFLGPGYLVAVGYMDPGNWATDLGGGSKYGYALLWVVLASSLMAMLLQTLCVRMGISLQRDLAQACRDYYPKPVTYVLWLLCELAIIACDLAEVIGAAVALNLLFGLPVVWGVILTGLDVLLLLAITRFGFRKLEFLIIALVATILGAFILNIVAAQPAWGEVAKGLVTVRLPDHESLFLAIGILGATVMPHNLYLHTSLVQTRDFEKSDEGRSHAIKMGTLDVNFALTIAFFVNSAILILAAAVFWQKGQVVSELQEAHRLLNPLLSSSAAFLFAIALLCAGQSSTITGTLAGQIVMEGFLGWRIEPWKRRLITRSLAVVPAVFLLSASGGKGTQQLLELSQVVLSMQLPFAVFPLVGLTSSKKLMGRFANPLWLSVAGYAVGGAITTANLWLLWTTPSIGPYWVSGTLLVLIAFGAWVKYFYKEVPEPATDAERSKRHAASLSLTFNVVSTFVKIFAAVITGSVSLLSEAIHSAADIFSSGLAFVGIRAAAQPADEDHPYGHGKIESLVGFAESIMLMLTAIYISFESIRRLTHPSPLGAIDTGVWVMSGSAVFALLIGRYAGKVGRETQSIALKSNSQHLMADCATSAGVLGALILAKVTGWTFIDPVVAIALAAWMAYSSWTLGVTAYQQLIDQSLSNDEVELVRSILKNDERVLSFHRLRTRLSGTIRHIDVHIVVSRNLTVVESHEIADSLEGQIRKQLIPSEIVIHVDPYDPHTEEPE